MEIGNRPYNKINALYHSKNLSEGQNVRIVTDENDKKKAIQKASFC